ncbi:hypothetical protein [Butyricimonas paravirosa]|uniref:hypothetical protein n=1 Tax=Butyricimonas paravirosa TaxID=1472417 RepID=UPI00210CE68F|nr:hypothetical protein [Butyricimonas paravirosa]MCQ4875847.1 hypothetical protein [Butyricimonas paravirosa]
MRITIKHNNPEGLYLNIQVNDVSIIINEKTPKSKAPVSKKGTKNRIVEHLKQTVSWKKMI